MRQKYGLFLNYKSFFFFFFRKSFAKRRKSKNATVSQRPHSITEKPKKYHSIFKDGEIFIEMQI